ncbi:MAG: prepilin peptidase [Candidatus Levyibacteriota bacterium]
MVIFLLFFLGLGIGSFLNVVIDRLPRGESVFKGRSHCEACKKKLAWYDLIPFVSFIILKGRCRYCHSPISFYYPVVELTTGITFVLVFLFFPNENIKYQISNIKYFAELIYYLFIVSSLIVIFFIDLKYGIIPDRILLVAVVATFAYVSLILNSLFLIHLLAGFGAFFFFLLIFLITKGKGMGFGDVEYVFLAGLFLGFPKIIIALYMAFIIGAFVALALVIAGRKKFSKDTIPFGPFLVLGTLLAFFYSHEIIELIPFLRLL